MVKSGRHLLKIKGKLYKTLPYLLPKKYEITLTIMCSLMFSNTTSYSHCFIVCILAPYSSWFTYAFIVVKFLISVTFWGAVLIRGRPLLEGSGFSDLSVKRCCHHVRVAFIWGLILNTQNMVYFSLQIGLTCYLN